MSLAPITGNEALRHNLAATVASGRLPQSLLFHGPRGAGKQRLALWLANLIVCEETDGPCGRCRSCILAGGLQHPDVHWFFPVPRPKGASASRLRQKLEEARYAELMKRAETPLAPRPADSAAGIFLAMVQEIRAKASLRPAMGDTAVFIVGDAERMVPQAANPEAANAFLKLLEEPPADTVVILTSSRPGALLPTIRSRVVALRVPPLPEHVVTDFLVAEAGRPETAAAREARAAEGSIGVALEAGTDDGMDLSDESEALVRSAMRGSAAERLRLAASLPASGARGRFLNLLDATGKTIRDCLAGAAGSSEAAIDPASAKRVFGDEGVPDPDALLTALEAVDEARDAAFANGNPQAIGAVLVNRMAVALAPQPVS